MSINLLDLVLKTAGKKFIPQLSSLLGESEDNLNSSIKPLIGTLLGGVMNKASDEKGAGELLNFITEKGLAKDDLLSNFSGVLKNSAQGLEDSGAGVLDFIFGKDKIGGVMSMLSSTTSLKSSVVPKVLKMISPLVLGTVGKYIKSEGLKPAGILSLFKNQKSLLSGVIPDIAKLGALSGGAASIVDSINKKDNTGGSCATGAGSCSTTAASGGKKKKGIFGFLLPLLVFLFLLSFLRGCLNGEAGDGAVGTDNDNVNSVIEETIDSSKKGLNNLADDSENALKGTLSSASGLVKGALDKTAEIADKAGDLAGNTLESGANIVKDAGAVVGDTIDSGANIVKDAGAVVGDTIDSGANIVKDAGAAVGDTIDAGTNLANNAINAGASIANEAIDSGTNAVKSLTSLKLPGLDSGIEVTAGSFEDEFAKYLAAKNYDKNKKFVFDNLVFNTGSAQVKDSSMVQLNNLAKILQAYPNVKVNVEGHTDNVGNYESNKTLSNSRANTVKNVLADLGVDMNRITSIGFGSDQPIADNNTDTGRAANRRVSLSVE